MLTGQGWRQALHLKLAMSTRIHSLMHSRMTVPIDPFRRCVPGVVAVVETLRCGPCGCASFSEYAVDCEDAGKYPPGYCTVPICEVPLVP